MKALFFRDGEDVHIELIAESQDEREQLIREWNNDSFAVSCEEWREQVEAT